MDCKYGTCIFVAPADDYFDGESFFDIEYRPDINQFQFNYNF